MNHRFATRLLCLLALAVPLLAFFGPGLLPGRTQIPLDALHAGVAPWRQHPAADSRPVNNPVITDQVLQFEPWAEFMRQELAAGRLPLWNPYVSGGVPFAANPQTAVFYPLSTPIAVADPDRSPALRSWLHALVAAFFTALFLRRAGLARFAAVGGGLLFALSQFMVAWIGYPLGWTMAWLPAWIYFAERLATEPPPCRAVLPAALVIAFTALAGHPESLFHITVIAVLYCAARSVAARGVTGCWRGPGRLIGAGLLGAGVAAILLAPFLEYLFASVAWDHRTTTAVGGGLPPGFLLGGLFPGLFGRPLDHWVHANFNERAFSAGAIAALAAGGALLHREAWRGPWPVLTVLGALGAVISFDFPGRWNTVSQLPGFSTAANHRMLALVVFVAAALAALGLDRIARHGLGRRWFAPVVGFYAVAALLLVGQAANWVGPLRHVPATQVKHAALIGVGVAVAAAAAALALRRRPGLAAITLTVLAVAEVALWGFGLNTVNPAAWRTRVVPEIAAIQSARPVRLVAGNGAFLPESNVAYRLPALGHYDAMGLRRFTRLTDELLPLDPGRLGDPRLHLVGVTHAYLDEPLADTPDGWRHEVCGAGHLYARIESLSRVFLCGRIETLPDEGSLLQRLASPAFDPGSGPALTAAAPPGPAPDRDLSSADRATVSEARPDRLAVEVDLAGPAVLVLRDAYFPGWRARAGETEFEIFPAFGGLRAIALPAGRHHVVFTYEPLALRLGAIASGVALVVLLLLAVRQLVSRRRVVKSSHPKGTP